MTFLIKAIQDSFFFIIGRIGVLIIDLLLLSCRITIINEPVVRPYLKTGKYAMASWHGRLILFFMGCRGTKAAVMTSRSKDGAIAARLQKSGGYRTFRGSSKKGGKDALSQISAYMQKHNRPVMLSVDGPTGPIYVVKHGIIKLASETGFPIIPITYSGDRIIVFRSWDRCIIPKPFSKGSVFYGNPIHVPKNCSQADMDKFRKQLEKELNRITEKADRYYGYIIK